MKRSEEIHLRAETLALVTERTLCDGANIELAGRRVPRDVKPHLKAAPGIGVKDKVIKKAAAGFDKTDFRSVMRDLNLYLRENLEYDGGRTRAHPSASSPARRCAPGTRTSPHRS